jgi:polyisoprenoid-binding protein YceI
VTGTVEYDLENVAATRVNATIGVTSVDTREPKRDEHLRSGDFFDAAKFPTMTFASKAVKNASDKGFDLVGDLTMRGVTQEVTLRVAPFTAEYKDPWGNIKIGTSATGSINRQDFGIRWNKALDGGGYILSDDVRIELDVELGRK